jgi:hypothetical protein
MSVVKLIHNLRFSICNFQFAIICPILLAGALILTAGCTSVSPPTHKGSDSPRLLPSLGIGEKTQEEKLRKKVESDPFPRAAEVGLN